MKRDIAHEIIAAIESLHVDERAKAEFRQALERIISIHGSAWSRREDRLTFARGLLALRVSRATIRDRVMARFDVSRGEAYRTIDAALKLSRISSKNETRFGFNGVSSLETLPDEKPT